MTAKAMRSLLAKYIAHIREQEGITFLRDDDREEYSDSVKFTDAEWALLIEISKEVVQ